MKIIIHRTDSKFYYFTIIAETLECLFVSPVYIHKPACLQAIEDKKDKMLTEAVQALRATIIDDTL